MLSIPFLSEDDRGLPPVAPYMDWEEQVHWTIQALNHSRLWEYRGIRCNQNRIFTEELS